MEGKVMARIKDAFYSAYPRSTVKLQHNIYPLQIKQEDQQQILAEEMI